METSENNSEVSGNILVKAVIKGPVAKKDNINESWILPNQFSDQMNSSTFSSNIIGDISKDRDQVVLDMTLRPEYKGIKKKDNRSGTNETKIEEASHKTKQGNVFSLSHQDQRQSGLVDELQYASLKLRNSEASEVNNNEDPENTIEKTIDLVNQDGNGKSMQFNLSYIFILALYDYIAKHSIIIYLIIL